MDTNGIALAQPSRVLDRVRVVSGGATLLDRSLSAADDTLIVLGLTQVITVSPGSSVQLDVGGDVGANADLGTVRTRLGPPQLFVARDAGGDTVRVTFETNPIEGADVTVRDRPDSLHVSAVPHMPATVFLGAADVRAFDIVLAHAGPAQAAPVRCAALTLRLRDQVGSSLVPSAFVDRVWILSHGVEVGGTGSLPTSGGEFTLPLSGVATAPMTRDTLEVHFAVEAAAMQVYLQMQVAADGVDARDALTTAPVSVAASPGLEFPMASGIGRLEPPARELAAGFRESMPAMLVADGRAVPVARLTLRNTAVAGEIRVDTLIAVTSDRDYRSLPIGGAATALEAWIGDSLWAAAGSLGEADPLARLVGASPIRIGAQATAEVELRLVAREGTAPFRIGVTRDGIGIDQPSSPLLEVALVSEEGQSFPFWSQSGSVGARSLEESYGNYPNPFAAGRGTTLFTYYLPAAARVTLQIRTLRGEPVRTLLDNDSRPAGLQQRDAWDGRNGRGQPVYNGVYLAELTVRYDDGKGTSVLRKVAVAR